jgi:hypothetical protein
VREAVDDLSRDNVAATIGHLPEGLRAGKMSMVSRAGRSRGRPRSGYITGPSGEAAAKTPKRYIQHRAFAGRHRPNYYSGPHWLDDGRADGIPYSPVGVVVCVGRGMEGDSRRRDMGKQESRSSRQASTRGIWNGASIPYFRRLVGHILSHRVNLGPHCGMFEPMSDVCSCQSSRGPWGPKSDNLKASRP